MMNRNVCGILLLALALAVNALEEEEEPCGVSADVAILIDNSAGIDAIQFNLEKQLAKDIVSRLDVSPERIRVSVLQYSDDVVVDFYLDQFDNAEDIGHRLDKLAQSDNVQSQTHLALKVARTKVLASGQARWNVPNICLLLSGRTSTQPKTTQMEAELAKESGITLIAVGFGKSNPWELESLVSDPAEENFIDARTSKDLKSVAFPQLAWLQACRAVPSTTRPPATTWPYQLSSSTQVLLTDSTSAPDLMPSATEMSKDSPGKSCQGKPADVVFVLDMSSSVWSVHFQQQLQFVTTVIDTFDVDTGKTQVGAVVFSDTASVVFDVDMYNTKNDIADAILNIRSKGGVTNTHAALQLVLDRMFTPEHGSRPGVAHICILITDGRSTVPQMTKALAEKIHVNGISLFVIGVGNMTVRSELAQMASEPTEEFLFEANGYDALPKLRDILAFRACEVLEGDLQSDQPRCFPGQKTDIVFGLYNIGGSHRDHVAEFIKSVAGELDLTSGSTRIAITESSGDAMLNLQTFSNMTNLANAIDNTMTTGVSGLIQRMRKTIAGSRRNPGINRIAVLFVSGTVKDMRTAYSESMRLKFFGSLVVVGIGHGVDTDQLMRLATHRNKYEPDISHVLPVNDLSELPLVVDKLRVLMCKDE